MSQRVPILLILIGIGWMTAGVCQININTSGSDEFTQFWIPAPAAPLKIEEYKYVSSDASKQSRFSEAIHRYSYLESGEIDVRIDWRFATTGVEGTEQSRLTSDYSTIMASIVVEKEGSSIIVKRLGNQVQIKGRFHNQTVDTALKIDNKPFYTNPTVGFKGFVLSGQKNSQFWLLRPDKLEILRMRVEDEGNETIILGGVKTTPAIRLKWKPVGFKSLFFSEVYWFGGPDKVFLKNISRDGIETELVSGFNG